jgi:hypothetical protein
VAFPRYDRCARIMEIKWLIPSSKRNCLGIFALLAMAGSAFPAAFETNLEVVFELPLGPAGLTMSPRGTYILSVAHEEKPQNRAVEITSAGESKPFPTTPISQALEKEPLTLDAVSGLELGPDGLIWMLDTGRRSEIPAKIVGWDYEHKKLARVINLTRPAMVPGSIPENIAVDPAQPFLYLADHAVGAEAALIVLDLGTGLARRVLQGHPSVSSVSGLDLTIDGQKIESKRLDGTTSDPIGGVNPLALDRKGEWLYFGPLRSPRLYRLRTEHLRNAALEPDKLAGLVEQYSDKPICAGITLDSKGNVYVSDLANKAIGMIATGTRKYSILVSDPRFLWPDGLCFGADGRLYFYTNTRRTANTLARRVNQVSQPNYLFRISTPASGRVGS